MAGLVGGVIGAVVGTFLGIGPQLGWMIGSTLGTALGGSGQKQQGPKLDDLRPQGSEYGRAIPLVYGSQGIAGNVIWATDLEEVQSSSGGKGGGPEITSFTYFANFAVMLCEGPVSFGKIWAGPDKRLIWDGATLEGGGAIRFYNGTEEQLPDPLIESKLGAGNVPAYRGFAYIVFERFPVANDGNRIPFLTVEVGELAQDNAGAVNGHTLEILRNDTAQTYVAVLNGSWTGAIVHTSDHGLVGSFRDDYTDPTTHAVTHEIMQFNSGAGQNFIDHDRNRLCRVTPGGGFCYMSLTDGHIVFANPYPNGLFNQVTPAAGVTNPGSHAIGACYKDGLYVVMCSGSSDGRLTITALNPSDLTTAWTLTSTATSVMGFFLPRIYSLQSGDNTIVCYRTTNCLCKVVYNAAGLPHGDIANAVPPTTAYGHVCAAINFPTQTIWAAWYSGTGLSVSGHDLSPEFLGAVTVTTAGAGGSPFDHVTFFNTSEGVDRPTNAFLQMNPWVMTPNYWTAATDGSPVQYNAVACCSVTSDITASDQSDMFVEFILPGAPLKATSGGMTVSSYRGVDFIGPVIQCGFFNPGDSQVWFARKDMWIDSPVAGSVDFTSVSVLGGGPPGTHHRLAAGAGLSAVAARVDLIILDLCTRAGLNAGEINVSALADQTVDGFAIAAQTSVRDALTPLQATFYFDAVESSGVLKFVKRGGGVVLTIPDSDLAARIVEDGATPGDTQTEDLLLITRMMDAELPHTLTVQYISRATDYSAATVYQRRLVDHSLNEEKMDLPMVLSDAKATEVAQINLHTPWVRRRSFQWKLPKSYCELEPTDVVSIRGNTVFVTKATMNAGVIEMEGVFDDFSYAPHVVVTETPPNGVGVPVPGLTVVEFM